MATTLKLKGCCFCFSTKTGSIIIASLNLFLSIIGILMTGIMLLLFLAVGAGLEAHGLLLLVYIALGIGLLTTLSLFASSIMLIRGVVTRRHNLVYYYLIYGSIATFLSLVSVAIGIFSKGILITSIIIFVLEFYFLAVIYSEYRNIVEEKELENDEVPPYSMQNPNVQDAFQTK